MANNLTVEREGGVALASGSKVKPGELLTLVASGFSAITDWVNIKVWEADDPANILFSQQVFFPIFGIGDATTYFTVPYTEGVQYVAQAFGFFAEKSNIVRFTVSSAAPNPKQPPEGSVASTLKTIMVIGAVGLALYFVVDSGLLSAGAQAVKRKLNPA